MALSPALKLGQGLDHLKDGHDAALLLEVDNEFDREYQAPWEIATGI